METNLHRKKGRKSELTAIARLIMYAQVSARELGASEVDQQLARSLEAVIRELEGNADLLGSDAPAPSVVTCQ